MQYESLRKDTLFHCGQLRGAWDRAVGRDGGIGHVSQGANRHFFYAPSSGVSSKHASAIGWKRQEESAVGSDRRCLHQAENSSREPPALAQLTPITARMCSASWGPRCCQFCASFRNQRNAACSETVFLTPTAQRRPLWHKNTSWVSYNEADQCMVNTAFQCR